MEKVESETDDWAVNCSDEELMADNWEPSPSEILNMYETLEAKGMLDIEWQCPGRRSPSVTSNNSDLLEKGSASDEDCSKQIEPNEFDFEDEFSAENSTIQIARKRNTNATSAQRRVARLDKVMHDIQRHRKLDELQKSVPHSANNASNEQKTN